MTDIKYIQLKPMTSGYVLDVNYNRPTPSQEFAYSDLDDLLNGLTRLLGPTVPVVLGMDSEPDDGRDRSVTGLVHCDNEGHVIEVIDDDDGWREWSGELRPGQRYPPGVKPFDQVNFRLRKDSRDEKEIQAERYGARMQRWFWAGKSGYDVSDDIVAYRVVKP